MMYSSRRIFRYFLLVFTVVLICFVIIGFQLLSEDSGGEEDSDDYVDYKQDDHISLHEELEQLSLNTKSINKPIIIWWTPFTQENGKYKTCGKDVCFFTIKKKYRNHPRTKVFMFYGSDLKFEDLPLPRLPHHEWALFHEESPKNNYLFSHAEVMTLFNHTCTFRRESDYPITTQYLVSLDWLQQTKYLVSVKEKNDLESQYSPIIYTHSDCDPPSDRDSYVKLLMKLVSVDSYGDCLHNKDLPPHLQGPIKGMDHSDFYELVGKYKFALAMENGICTDYITEKLWRPLMVGAVPIVYGSPKVRELLPSNHSAILIEDFKTVEELAAYIKFLDQNDAEYEKYLEWKKTGVTNPVLKKILQERKWSVSNAESWFTNDFNFVDGFECFVCNRVHENMKLKSEGKKEKKHYVSVDHYGCPPPKKFSKDGDRLVTDRIWQSEWDLNGKMAKSLRFFIDHNIKFTRKQLLEDAFKDIY